jgi:hypothetical protein
MMVIACQRLAVHGLVVNHDKEQAKAAFLGLRKKERKKKKERRPICLMSMTLHAGEFGPTYFSLPLFSGSYSDVAEWYFLVCWEGMPSANEE